jgi:hypothetical protein
MSEENEDVRPIKDERNPLARAALAVPFEYNDPRADAWTTRTPRGVLISAMIFVAVAAGLFTGCGGGDAEEGDLSLDSPPPEVTAVAETDTVPPGGDADDPAIWVNPHDPAKSTIIGTDKLGGLAVYNLAGNQIQYLPTAISTMSTFATAFGSAASR